jgi:hypothetical protein
LCPSETDRALEIRRAHSSGVGACKLTHPKLPKVLLKSTMGARILDMSSGDTARIG